MKTACSLIHAAEFLVAPAGKRTAQGLSSRMPVTPAKEIRTLTSTTGVWNRRASRSTGISWLPPLTSRIRLFGTRASTGSESNGADSKKGAPITASSSSRLHPESETWENGAAGIPSFTWPDQQRPRICILGGGFGGLYTALRINSLVWPPGLKPQVVLIDQSDRFVFKPLLYELLTKEVDVWEIAPTFSDLLHSASSSSADLVFLRDSVSHVLTLEGPRDASSPSSSSSSDRLPSPSPQSSVLGGKRPAGSVRLASGTELPYDWLVLALGAETRSDFVAGATQYALPFATLHDAVEVDQRLTQLERRQFASSPSPPPIRVVVVGAGYSGVELAATVAERLGARGTVQIIDPAPDICTTASAGNRDAAKKILRNRRVDLFLGQRVTKISASGSEDSSLGSESDDQQQVFSLEWEGVRDPQPGSGKSSGIHQADLVLWTVGSRPKLPQQKPSPPPTSDAEAAPEKLPAFPLTARGQADVDAMLRVRGHQHVFALGDSAGCADEGGRLLPGTAQVAIQQADYVGWNIWASINSMPLIPFHYTHLGEMLTLGTTEGAVTVLRDLITLEGPLAHIARKAAYLYRLPTIEHKAKVGASWLIKSAIDAATLVQDTVASMASEGRHR